LRSSAGASPRTLICAFHPAVVQSQPPRRLRRHPSFARMGDTPLLSEEGCRRSRRGGVEVCTVTYKSLTYERRRDPPLARTVWCHRPPYWRHVVLGILEPVEAETGACRTDATAAASRTARHTTRLPRTLREACRRQPKWCRTAEDPGQLASRAVGHARAGAHRR